MSGRLAASDSGPDVLAEPLISVQAASSTGVVSLAGLVAHLLCGPEIISFPSLTAEQRGFWWRFLVRCATKALHELGTDVDEASGETIESLSPRIEQALRARTPEGAWLLHNSIPTQPAFLQPPTPDGAPPETGYRAESASLLTPLIGGKSHERKANKRRLLTPVGGSEDARVIGDYRAGRRC